MSTIHDQFIGVGNETGYSTGVAPTDFFEVLSEDIAGAYERIESESIRGGVLRADRFAPNPKGAAGSLEVEVLDKGFDFWLEHMLGDVTVTGDGSVTPFAYSAVLGSLSGKSFSLQAARYASAADTLIPFAYHGGKVAEWSLSCEVDAIVKANLSMDFAREVINGSGADALAVATYPADAQLMTFIGGSVTVDGLSFAVSSVTVSGVNGLKVDRYALRGANGITKREPKASDMQEITFELSGEFDNDTHSQRIAASLASGALATIALDFDSPQGGALSVSLPAARFDAGPVNIARAITEQGISGKALAPTAGGSAITVDYTTVL